MDIIKALLYVILFLVVLLILLSLYSIFINRKLILHRNRRRWARVSVPKEREIVCLIIEPNELSNNKGFTVIDINVGGISFISDKPFDKQAIKLSLKFPFSSFKEAGIVWGKVVHCTKIYGTENYRIGIAYARKTKWSKAE